MKSLRRFTFFIMWAMILNLFGCKKQLTADDQTTLKDSATIQMDKVFEEFKNRAIYKELTVEIIDKTPDDKLLQTIIDNLYEKYPEDHTKEYETVLRWTSSRLAIYFIWSLDGEVNNGGFNQ